jgi:DNA-binding MarR family transcriptional regulator
MRVYGNQAMPKQQHAAPAEPLSPCNCLAIRQAARHVSQFYDRQLAASGLRASQFSILRKLARLGPLSINELAGMMVMERTAMGRALRPLERDGLIAVGAGRDRRTRALRLTPAGEARLAAAEARWREAQQQFEETVGGEASAALRETLARVIAVVP